MIWNKSTENKLTSNEIKIFKSLNDYKTFLLTFDLTVTFFRFDQGSTAKWDQLIISLILGIYLTNYCLCFDWYSFENDVFPFYIKGDNLSHKGVAFIIFSKASSISGPIWIALSYRYPYKSRMSWSDCSHVLIWPIGMLFYGGHIVQDLKNKKKITKKNLLKVLKKVLKN